MNADSPKLTIATHTDLIEVLPLLTGYRPTESLVALFVDTTGRAPKAARFDLTLDPAHLADMFMTLIEQSQTSHDRAESVHLVAYSEDHHTAVQTLLFITDNWAIHTRTHDTSTGPGTVLGMIAAATADSWAAVNPDDPTEPTQWLPYPAGTSIIAAEAVLAGAFTEYQSRNELAATVKTPQPEAAAAFAARVAAISQPATIDTMIGWMGEWITNGYPSIDENEAAELTAAVQTVDVRDTAWCHISPADARHHVNLWRHIASRVDGTIARPVIGLLAAAAWIDGNGTLANIALDRADHTPGADTYSLFSLLHQLLRSGMPPSVWPGIRADLAEELRNRPQP